MAQQQVANQCPGHRSGRNTITCVDPIEFVEYYIGWKFSEFVVSKYWNQESLASEVLTIDMVDLVSGAAISFRRL